MLDTISSDMQYINGIQNSNPENSTNMLTIDLTTSDFDKISDIIEKEYNTFSEALAAAQQICME